jgi:large subunit ribosomal protein L22
MEKTVWARYQKASARKVKPVIDQIRGKTVEEAYRILRFIPRRVTSLVEKTLHSGVAIFGKNVDLNKVYIKKIWVTPGPKRFGRRVRAAAMGRGSFYYRKSAHLAIVISDEK